MFNALFSGSYVGIFWFFPPLICIYLAIPLFSAIKGNKTKLFKYLAIVGFILNIAVPFLINLFNYYLGTEFLWKYNLSVIGDYLIYPVIGYLLHNDKLTKKMRITVYVLAIVSLVVHILGTYYVSHDAGAVVRLFKGYLNVPCFFYSIGVFVFIKQLSNSEKLVSIIKKPVLFLQKYSFAFYLLHFFVLGELARQFEPLGLSVNNLLYVFIAFILTIPICILLTFLIRKIPVVGKYILP